MQPLYLGQSIYFSVYNRGKKSITLNLYDERGRRIFEELVSCSDIVLENFRPGVIAKMGFGYEVLRRINPSIILVSVSGYGQYGPYKDRPAFDPIGQAMSGLMQLTGAPLGQPIATASSIIDRVASLHATIGTLGALFHRQITGHGQVVDACLLDAGLTLTEIPVANYLLTVQDGSEPGRTTFGRGAIRARDGWVIVSPSSGAIWGRLLKAIGHPELAEDPRYAGISVAQPELRAKVLAEWVAGRAVAEVVKLLSDADVPCAPVNTVAQAAHDPHLWEREMLVEVADSVSGKMFVPGTSVKLSDTPARTGPVPVAGQDNEQIYCGLLGHSRGEMADLQNAGVV
jgi:crotonobetainyl-CoA:carnitine CoA-transferase CaiB-like acyl-CoA transferase